MYVNNIYIFFNFFLKSSFQDTAIAVMEAIVDLHNHFFFHLIFILSILELLLSIIIIVVFLYLFLTIYFCVYSFTKDIQKNISEDTIELALFIVFVVILFIIYYFEIFDYSDYSTIFNKKIAFADSGIENTTTNTNKLNTEKPRLTFFNLFNYAVNSAVVSLTCTAFLTVLKLATGLDISHANIVEIGGFTFNLHLSWCIGKNHGWYYGVGSCLTLSAGHMALHSMWVNLTPATSNIPATLDILFPRSIPDYSHQWTDDRAVECMRVLAKFRTNTPEFLFKINQLKQQYINDSRPWMKRPINQVNSEIEGLLKALDLNPPFFLREHFNNRLWVLEGKLEYLLEHEMIYECLFS